MSEQPEPTVTNDTAPVGEPNAANDAPAADTKAPADHGAAVSESERKQIDREVAEMMADVSQEAGLAMLCGRDGASSSVTPGESVEPGSTMTGTLVGVGDDEVFLEFGAKCQGVLARSQFGKKESVEVGRRVDVVVERYDEASGLLVVNRVGVIQRASWINLSVGSLAEGRVTGVIKGGLEVDLQGIRAFMPVSQVSTSPMKDVSVLLNEKIRCEVIEFSRRSKNVIVSRRKVLEREEAEARRRLRAELAVGQVRKGTVKNIVEFGAFVDLGGVQALLHIRDLSWRTVEKVSDLLSVGQEVEVKVLKIDEKRDRISLGLKQATPDPWVNVPERYPVGTELTARVIRLADFGAFVEIEEGVEALIPISEMGWTRLKTTSDAVAVGDMVQAVVIRAEPAKRRLALSMKQVLPDPWSGVLESFSPQSLVPGRVTRLADFGAFVELVPGVEGLIHISELADRRVKTCGDVVHVDQELEVRVLGVNQEDRRISLSLRQVTSPSTPDGSGSDSAPTAVIKKKRKKPLRGGLSSHFEW